MWNVFKKVWVKTHGNNAASVDACNIGYADGGDVTNGERTLSPQHFPRRSSLRMRGSRQHEFRFLGTLTYRENKDSLSWMPDQVGHDSWDDTTPSDIPSPSVSARRPLLSETGRSMIEMLGVLAIIGVLSIAAVAGYRFALLKFRANEVTNELNMRAINVSAQMLNTGTVYEKNELIEDGFGDTLTVGFPVETAISDRNTDYFEILVSDIPADLCRQILRDYENPIMIFVNNVRYNADTTICDDETQNALNDMGFIYKNDLGTHEACSEKGYFDEEDFQCHCSGNTYLDIYTNDCLCPAGHVWSAGEGTCIESICPEGQFESLKNGCVPCADEKTYQITSGRIALCHACGNRVATENNSTYYCANTDTYNCQPGVSYRTTNGTCVSCTSTSGYDSYLGKEISKSDLRDLCNACPDRYVSGNVCVLNTTCERGKTFRWVTSAFGCVSCTTTTSYDIGLEQAEHDLCRACSGREVIDNKCVKTTCDPTEFKGADGKCYPCTQGKVVEIGENSGCTSTTCGRTIITQDDKTYCQLTTCQTQDGSYVRTSNGSCFDCASKDPFTATAKECDSCATKRALVNGNICMLASLCTLGKSYPYLWGNYCVSCATNGYPMGTTTDFSRDHCEACDGHVVGGYCFLNNKCTKGSEFQSTAFMGYNNCLTCDTTQKIQIGTHAIEREYCLACTTKPRFWAGSYCYRCDSSETPGVTTSEEEDSCNSCAEREIKDGKCILIQ